MLKVSNLKLSLAPWLSWPFIEAFLKNYFTAKRILYIFAPWNIIFEESQFTRSINSINWPTVAIHFPFSELPFDNFCDFKVMVLGINKMPSRFFHMFLSNNWRYRVVIVFYDSYESVDCWSDFIKINASLLNICNHWFWILDLRLDFTHSRKDTGSIWKLINRFKLKKQILICDLISK